MRGRNWDPETPNVTVHIKDVPRVAITDALIAIEIADRDGIFDEEQHQRLTSLVLGLREARET